jgi:hypothetical protein
MPTSKVQEHTKKVLFKMSETIKERNEKFRAMSKKKQRMAIAKEVLSLISGNRVSAERGVYIQGEFIPEAAEALHKLVDEASPVDHPLLEIDWQQLLPKVRQCCVCMLGIAAVASIRLRNGASLESVGGLGMVNGINLGRDDCTDLLMDIFDERELDEMEAFFESGSWSVTPRKAVEIFWRHILRNKGKYSAFLLHKDYVKERIRQKNAKAKGKKRG